MTRICEITGIKTMSGNNVSHSNRHTRRKFYCNLQNVTVHSNELNKSINLRISAKGLRLIERYDDIVDFIKTNEHKITSKKLLNFIK